MKLPGRTCTTCGARDLIAVDPGQEAERAEIPGLSFALTPARPVRCWCARCALLRPATGEAA